MLLICSEWFGSRTNEFRLQSSGPRQLIGKFIHQGPSKTCLKMRPLLAAYLIRRNGFKLCILILIAQDLHCLAGAPLGGHKHSNHEGPLPGLALSPVLSESIIHSTAVRGKAQRGTQMTWRQQLWDLCWLLMAVSVLKHWADFWDISRLRKFILIFSWHMFHYNYCIIHPWREWHGWDLFALFLGVAKSENGASHIFGASGLPSVKWAAWTESQAGLSPTQTSPGPVVLSPISPWVGRTHLWPPPPTSLLKLACPEKQPLKSCVTAPSGGPTSPSSFLGLPLVSTLRAQPGARPLWEPQTHS